MASGGRPAFDRRGGLVSGFCAVYATRSKCETDLGRYEEWAEVDWRSRQHLVWTIGGHWSWGLEKRGLVMSMSGRMHR